MVSAIGHAPTAIAALLAAHDAPGQTIQDLRRTIGLSHGASVRVIDTLEGAQLVVRKPARHDGRAVAVHPTEAGSRAALRVLTARRQVSDALVALVPPAWLPRLVRILETLLTAQASDVSRALRICRFLCLGRLPDLGSRALSSPSGALHAGSCPRDAAPRRALASAAVALTSSRRAFL